MDDLEKFTEFIYGDQTGYVYAPVKRPNSDWEQAFFTWPEQKTEFHDWIKTASLEADVYVSPVMWKEKRATKDAVKSSQVVWVEFDGQEAISFTELGEKPNLIVQTSNSTHLHCYWKVPDTPVGVIEDINHRLTYFLGADASGFDITQVLRPPDSFNRKPKYDQVFPVKLVHYSEGQLDPSKFDIAPKIEFLSTTVEEADVIPVRKLLQELHLPASVKRRVMSETVGEGARSSFLSLLAYELVEERLEHLQIVSILAHVDDRIGKFTGRRDRMLRLTQLADMAMHKLAVSDQAVVYTLEDILNHTDDLEWILPGWLHTGGMMILTSAPGVGKTQFVTQMGVQLVKGDQIVGKKSMLQREETILFLSLEMDVRALKYIVSHQSKEYGIFEQKRFKVIDETDMPFAQLENLIDLVTPTVLIIDSLTDLMGDGPDANAEAKATMRWLKTIRRRYNLAIVLIHHNRKANDSNKKPKSLSDLYGSFIFAQATDTVIGLWEDAKGIELSAIKARYGQKGPWGYIDRNENLWFSLRKQDDTSNNPGTIAGTTGIDFNFGLSGGRHGD